MVTLLFALQPESPKQTDTLSLQKKCANAPCFDHEYVKENRLVIVSPEAGPICEYVGRSYKITGRDGVSLVRYGSGIFHKLHIYLIQSGCGLCKQHGSLLSLNILMGV